LIQTGWYNLTK